MSVSAPNELESFSDFDIRLQTLRAVERMGITTPTSIQAKTIPALLDGRDVVGQAWTGSGKTLAFGVPTVEICDPKARGVQTLILVPTRELAIQVAGVVSSLAKPHGLDLQLLYGGHSLAPERKALKNGVQIVVGTPGRTLDHLRQGSLVLKSLRLCVLDEGDQMLDQGFAPDVERILGYTPNQRQTALFSATVPGWVTDIASRHLEKPVTIRIHNTETPPEIQHIVYQMDPGTKIDALRTLLDNRDEGPALIFGRTKYGVTKMTKKLAALGYSIAGLQGNLSQNARERVMKEFRSGRVPILLATNVAARGLDIAGVDLVINFELPESPELFTHRAGRTGRMGRSGKVITFITPDDARKWRQFERALDRRMPAELWGSPTSPKDPPSAHHRPQGQPRQAHNGNGRHSPNRAPTLDPKPLKKRSGGPRIDEQSQLSEHEPRGTRHTNHSSSHATAQRFDYRNQTGRDGSGTRRKRTSMRKNSRIGARRRSAPGPA